MKYHIDIKVDIDENRKINSVSFEHIGLGDMEVISLLETIKTGIILKAIKENE